MLYNSMANEILTLGLDLRVTYWSMAQRSISKQLQAGFEVEVTAIAISQDGKLIVTGDE
jgi:hypothetical protein